jgi:hypothetical protein
MATCRQGQEAQKAKFGHTSESAINPILEPGRAAQAAKAAQETTESDIARLIEFRREHEGVICPQGHHTRYADLLGDPNDEDYLCVHCAARNSANVVGPKAGAQWDDFRFEFTEEGYFANLGWVGFREPLCPVCPRPIRWVLDKFSFMTKDQGQYLLAHADCVWPTFESIRLLNDERAAQVEEYDEKHDDAKILGSLALAGAAYALHDLLPDVATEVWPWKSEEWRPVPKDRLRELIKSGALIAAEIDRLLRKKKAKLIKKEDKSR